MLYGNVRKTRETSAYSVLESPVMSAARGWVLRCEIHNAGLQPITLPELPPNLPPRAFSKQLRAERRCGELLKELARGQPGVKAQLPATLAGNSPYRGALERTGISERSAERYQELANVPADTFGQHLAPREAGEDDE
jgi:hypothetical protein